MTALVLLMSFLGANPVVVSSATCSVTLEGLRIVEIQNHLNGEILRPSGSSAFTLFDAAYKPIPLQNPQISIAGKEVVVRASSTRGDQLKVAVWPDGEDVCLRLEAQTVQPGLRAVGFGIGGASESCSFIAPILGGMELTPTTPVSHIEQMYPGNWQSQFALFQGKRGGIWVRSTDTRFGFKWIFFNRNPPNWNAEFRNETPAPYTERSYLLSPEWRIAAYHGDWRVPTERYRRWMGKAFGLTPFDPKSWEAGIRCVVTTSPQGMTNAGLDLLARRLRPRQTLIYIPNWRTHPYDVMYPDYDPAPGVADRVKAAQARGFRVMLHTDFPGVTGAHPFFQKVKQYQLRDAVTKAPIGWWLDKKVPQSFHFIDPASSIYRAEFVRRMLGIRKTVGPDAIHLDVSAPTWNDGNGLIDGMTYPQGARRMHDDLAKALPGMVWGGEGLTESTIRHERFWQVWPGWITNNTHPHPITTALYWPYCRGYGYLGMPDPTLGETTYVRYLEQYDYNDFLVTIPIHNLARELSKASPALDALCALARAHQDTLSRPDLAAMVHNGNHSVWRGKHHSIRVTYHDGLAVTTVGRKAVLAHGYGIRAAKHFYPTGEWPAWNQHGAFGLDPTRHYLLTPTRPTSRGLRITRLTGGATQLVRCAAYPGAISLELASYPPKPAIRLANLYANAKTFIRHGNIVRPIEDGAVCQFEEHTSGGVTRNALYILPPWHKPTADWVTGMRFKLRAPANAELHCWIGIDDNAKKTDGITFLVFRDGKEIYRRHYTKKRWQEICVPLGNTAAQNMTLELATHPGPRNDPSWDLGLFGNPVIIVPATSATSATRIDFVPKSMPALTTQGARLIRPGELEVPAPGTQPITLFTAKPQLCHLPYDLLKAHLTPYVELAGASRSGSIYNSGEMHSVKSGGVERNALNAHPPNGGQTVFPWVGMLPPDAKSLRLTCGLADGATTDGVTFSIRINGHRLWNWFTAKPGWRDATVDLRPYAGHPILLELVTDSGLTNNCDWANWAALRIE